MNTREYISSGILESYAAGQLSESESKEVENNIKKYKELKAEYGKIQNTLYLSALNNLKTPSEKVKNSLFENISSRQPIANNSNSVTVNQYPVNSYRYLMAASIVFFLLSLGVNFYLWTKLKDADNEIAVLNDQKKIMVQEYEAVNRKLGTASRDMEIMKDRNYKMVDLKGLEKSPNSNVLAFWNPESKKLYVSVMNLPVPPTDKQYQLWALSGGKPIDAGVMDVDPSDKSLHEMKSMEDAEAFAITLEPKGGSVNPTLNEMYVMGKI
ncbi:MAG: anti-sigma factor [Ignavibacteria bacterium]|nr:anti-sigma factor [Ignavibacteria bacterium]